MSTLRQGNQAGENQHPQARGDVGPTGAVNQTEMETQPAAGQGSNRWDNQDNENLRPVPQVRAGQKDNRLAPNFIW